jgi:phage terminase small subunit
LLVVSIRMARLTMISLALFCVAYIILTKADAPISKESIEDESEGNHNNGTGFSITDQAPRRMNKKSFCPEGRRWVQNRCRKVV